MHYYLEAFKKYAQFSGRSRRSEFWCFYVVNLIVDFILAFVTPVLSLIYALIILVPCISLSTRRLHDIGKSGWNYLWGITGVGIIPLIIWWAREGEPDDNQYGSNPKVQE